MTKLIDLRPDKELANSNFEKYQFCSDDVPIKLVKPLENDILRLELSTSQESLLESKLFAFHNHLVKNPYNSTCNFIDEEGQIWCFKLDGTLEIFHKSTIFDSESINVYNPSIAFVSEDMCVVCNGGKNLEFLIKVHGQVTNFLFTDIEPAVIFDAKFIEQSKKIIVALYKVEESDNKKFSRIIILSYDYEEKFNNKHTMISVGMFQKQILKVKGSVEYIHIENNGKFVHVISQDQVEFEYDSVNPVKSKDSLLKDSDIKIPKYCWSQDGDSITVYIKIPEQNGESAAKVDVSHFNLSIKVEDKILLNGETANKLEPELTTWKRKDNNLEIQLSKSESGLMWNELIKGDTGGEYLPNEALATEIHARLSHLCSSEEETIRQGQPAIGFNCEQLEECDLSGDENILQRLNINTHSITHMAMLGSSNRVLFAQKQLMGHVICIRYDHDGCIWIMKESENDDWDLQHTHTYPGFGYVEASKTNKKFCVSPPNGSYIAIVEHTRHAFLYEKPEKNTKVGRQKILDFGNETSPILGAAATNKYLIILTKNALYQLQVYS